MSIRYRNRIPQVTRGVEAHVDAVIRSGAIDILSLAQRKAPVRTGHLRNSGSMDSSHLHARVSFHANYATFVELGVRGREGKPFLKPAFNMVVPHIVRRIKDVTTQ